MGRYRGGGDLEGRIGRGGNSPEVGIGVMGGPGTGRYGDVGVGGVQGVVETQGGQVKKWWGPRGKDWEWWRGW